jgi:predicted permease
MRNLRLALRTLTRTPFVTTVAVLSLALGIGANAAIFSAFDQMLLAPLPVSQPGRLVNLGAPGPTPGSHQCGQAGNCEYVFSYPMFRDLEQASTSLSGVAAHYLFGANVAYGPQTLNREAAYVSGSYFPVLGVQPALGRLLTRSDDDAIGGHFVTVLSFGFWNRDLGADSGVLTKVLTINGQSFTIVGVAARNFEGTVLGAQPVAFVPITMRKAISPRFNGYDDRRRYWVYLFGRLKPNTSIAQAKATLNGVFKPIINSVEAPLQKGLSDQTMARFRAREMTVEEGSRGQSTARKEAKPSLILLLATTGIVLLIACANIANLLLARAANRSGEFAIRLSLGATRAQLLRQLLTESFVLAALGGIVSLVIARWTLGLITALLPGEMATVLHLQLRMSAVWFTGVVAAGTGLLFGLFPALHSTRPNLDVVLRSGSAKLAGGRAASRVRTSLVTAQIALSMALLISSGLFIRSLRNVSRVDLGLRADSLVMFHVSPVLNGYPPSRSAQFFVQLQDGLAAIPGVTAVSSGLVAIVAGNNWDNNVNVQGFAKGPDTDADAHFNAVGPGYFRALGIPVLTGREFTPSDITGSPRVAVVNEAFVRKFHLGNDAVGKYMGEGDSLTTQIVGVVKDSKYSNVKLPIPPVYFLPYRQDTTVGSLTFYARTSSDTPTLLRSIPGVVHQLDAALPVEDLKTVPDQVRANTFLDRMLGTLALMFAALATLLAAVGLYGVLAYSVAQRTREIGVRMALGADAGRVRTMILRQVGVMTLIGAPIGVAGAIAMGYGARSILYGLAGTDPLAIVGAAGVLALVALGAGYIPARRASRVDPVQAIRYE